MALTGVTSYFLPSDGQQWATYICDKLTDYSINSNLYEIKENEDVKLNPEHLSVFFITPDFLDLSTWTMLVDYDKDKSLLVLTGTDFEDLTTRGPEYDFLNKWNVHQLTNSAESVNDLFVMIIGLYEGHDYQSPDSTPDRTSVDRSSLPIEENDDPYDQIPFDKKARQVNGVFDVIYKDGVVYLMLDREAEGRLTADVGGHHMTKLRPEDIAVYTFPYHEIGVHTISVAMDSQDLGQIALSIPDSDDTKSSDVFKTTFDSKSTQTSNTPPPTLKKPVRPISSDRPLSNNAQRNSQNGGNTQTNLSNLTGQNKLDILREILSEETDPIYMMCKCFNIDKSTERLDEKLASLVESSAAFSHVISAGQLRDNRDEDEKSKWPTLFHFAARYNLIKFCQALLNNRLLHKMCVIKNADGRTAGDLAKENGHVQLAELLETVKKNAAKEKYDSGFDRDSLTDSSVTDGLPPPAPHIGYINVGRTCSPNEEENFDTIDESDDDDEDDYLSEGTVTDLAKRRHSPLEETYISMEPKANKTRTLKPPDPCAKRRGQLPAPPIGSPPFENVCDLKGTSCRYKPPASMARTGSGLSQTSMGSISSLSDGNDGPTYRHKNIAQHLGMSWSPPTPEPQKKQPRFKLFKHKKNRSYSEPNVPSEDQLRQLMSGRKGAKTDSTRTTPKVIVTRSSTFSGPPNLPPRHYGNTRRSTKTDSGSSSSSSNSAYLEINEVDLRGEQKSTSKLKFFKKTAKRKSMRLTKALEDQGGFAPKLPERRYNELF